MIWQYYEIRTDYLIRSVVEGAVEKDVGGVKSVHIFSSPETVIFPWPFVSHDIQQQYIKIQSSPIKSEEVSAFRWRCTVIVSVKIPNLSTRLII